MRRHLLVIIILLSALLALPVQAQNNPRGTLLIPTGGGSSSIHPELISAAINNARQGKIHILILPINLASDSTRITDSERSEILGRTEILRDDLEQDCATLAPRTLLCDVDIAPVLTRTDASDPDVLHLFTQDLSAIYIPDGERAIGVDVIGGTPLEYQLSRVYDQGVIVAGNGAGGVMQSNPMIGEHTPDRNPSNDLNFGSVEVWDTAEQHGLLFGIKEAMLEDRFFQEGKLAALLNAISLPNIPNIGIGLDENVGALIPSGDRVENVFGPSTIAILDAETYHSADDVGYTGKNNIISLRNILVHTLAPGDFYYDLARKRHSLGAPFQQLARTFEDLTIPPGAGPLMLTGDLMSLTNLSALLERFTQISGGADANILVLSGGYPSQVDAEQAGSEIAKMLMADSQVSVITSQFTPPAELSKEYSGIVLHIADPTKINATAFASIIEAWRQGVPLLLDGEATSLIGAFFVPPFATDTDGERLANNTKTLSIRDENATQAGLHLINANFIPRILEDNRWGQLFTLAYNHPDQISVGLSQAGAIEINEEGARSLGENPNFLLDFRRAVLDKGTNNAFVIANGLLDVFAPGQLISAAGADINSAPQRRATPILITPSSTPQPTLTPRPTSTPTVTITPTQSPTPTRRIRPTSTPIIIPPPSDPLTRNFMVLFGVLIVVVIIVGIWINRSRIN